MKARPHKFEPCGCAPGCTLFTCKWCGIDPIDVHTGECAKAPAPNRTRLVLKRRLFRRPIFVLQVEHTFTRAVYNGLDYDYQPVTKWRDVTPEDITEGLIDLPDQFTTH